MINALLSKPDQMEALSKAYVFAVGTRAGYTVDFPTQDRDGIDSCIRAGGPFRPGLDLQLKATTNLNHSKNGVVKFVLKLRNYNLLRSESQTPRLLVVLDLPSNENRWLEVTDKKLAIRRRAYYLNLKNSPKTSNKTSVTVEIPDRNVFNVENLRALMEQSREGQIL